MKMAREIGDAEHNCTNCNLVMKKKEFMIEGMRVRGWECGKCGETVLHPGDAQKMLIFNKLKKGIPVKVGELGQSLIIRFPKEIANFYNISKGGDITIRAEKGNKLELNIV